MDVLLLLSYECDPAVAALRTAAASYVSRCLFRAEINRFMYC